jgi:serine/threonine protein kinase
VYLIHGWLFQEPCASPFPDITEEHTEVRIKSQSSHATVLCFSNKFVIKWFHDPKDCEYEQKMLEHFRGIKNVLQVDAANQHWLKFDYLGSPLQAFHIDVALSVLASVKALHDKNVLHRDIKPGNIVMLPKARAASLIDFGLAVEVKADDRVYRGSFVGTSSFAPQEHLLEPMSDSLKYSQATDWESFVKTCIFLTLDNDSCTVILMQGRLCREDDESDKPIGYKDLYEIWESAIAGRSEYKDAIAAARKNDPSALESALKRFPKNVVRRHALSQSGRSASTSGVSSNQSSWYQRSQTTGTDTISSNHS